MPSQPAEFYNILRPSPPLLNQAPPIKNTRNHRVAWLQNVFVLEVARVDHKRKPLTAWDLDDESDMASVCTV
jgi:hypothetical protein